MRKTILLLTAMAAMLVAYLGAALAQTPSGTLDAHSLPAWTSQSAPLRSDVAQGQTFHAIKSGQLTSAQVSLARDTQDGDIKVELTTLDQFSHVPTNNVLATATIPAGTVTAQWPDEAQLVTVHFSNPAEVVAGQGYAILLSTENGSFVWHWTTNPANYPDRIPVVNTGSGWTGPVHEITRAFAAYVTPLTLYDFTGFFSPVDNPPTFNKAKAGSAIPVKFSLGGDMGLDIFAKDANGNPTSPTSDTIACNSNAEIDPIELTVNAGSSTLLYDPLSDQYTYVWKTNKGWNTCRQLVLKFDDGTVKRANFDFTK